MRYTGLILLPIYTKFAFTPGQYGVLESVNNLGTLLLAVAMLGLDGAVPLLYFEADDLQRRKQIITLWVGASVLLSAVVTTLLMFASVWLALAASGSAENADLFKLGVAVLPFTILQTVFSQVLRLTFRPRSYAILNFSLTTLVAVASILLVLYAGLGLSGALWGVLIGTAAVTVFSAWTVRDSVDLSTLKQSGPLLRRLLQLGLPLVPASVALWVISFSNTYFIIQLLGPAEAGVFRAGARLAALLGLGVWAFQLAWGPFSLSIAREEDAHRTYARVATLFTAGAVGGAVLLSAFAPVLLLLFTSSSYVAAASVIGLLSLAAAALGAYYLVATGVNLAQRTGQIAWTTLVAAGTNLALNALLIPLWGIVGAGLAALAANLTSTILVYTMSQRYYPLPYEAGKIATTWLVGSACVAAAGVFNAVAAPGLLMTLVLAVLLTVVYAAALFAARVVTVRDLRVLRQVTLGPGWERVIGLGQAALARPALVLAGLVVLAFVLRVGFMVATHTLNAAPQEDELDYHHLAQNLLAGHGYSLDGVPVVNRAPAYPFFLALVYTIFGESPTAARLVQAVLLALAVPLIYLIGRRGWGPGVGLGAAALFAVYPFSVFWGHYLITENLLVVLFAGAGALLVCPGERRAWRLLAGGIVLGLAMLTRPTALPVVVLLVAWLLLAVRPLRKGALFGVLLLAGLAVAMSPWVARNYETYGRFIPFTSGYGSSAGGYVFWISNNALTAQPGEKWGRYVDPALLPEHAEYESLPNDPALLDRKGYEYGLRYLANHPGDVPVLLLGKFLRFWNIFPGAQLYTKAVGALVIVLLPFFMVGLWRAWRDLATGGLPLAFIVGTMLVGLIFWADTRTRAPAEPFILLVSVVGVAHLVRSWGTQRNLDAKALSSLEVKGTGQ